MIHAFHIIRFYGDGVALQNREWVLLQVVHGRRVEKGVERNLITPQVFLGHVLCGFGQQSRHCTSWWGVLWLSGQQEKKDHQCHVCHWPTRNTVCHVTLVSDSHNDLYNISEVLRGCCEGSRFQTFSYRGASSMQMQVLTQSSSGVCVRNMRCSQTLPSINAEECKERRSSLKSCFAGKDIALKGPMRGWFRTETY